MKQLDCRKTTIEHVPTPDSKAKVVMFSCAGFSHEKIASYFDISPDTLRKHYKVELDDAKMEKLGKLSDTAYGMALAGNEKMLEFVLKTQGRWAYAKPPEDTNNSALTVLELLERFTRKE